MNGRTGTSQIQSFIPSAPWRGRAPSSRASRNSATGCRAHRRLARGHDDGEDGEDLAGQIRQLVGEKAIRLRLTELSTSSIDISTVIMLRRTTMPNEADPKSTKLNTR